MPQSSGVIKSLFWKAGERVMVQGLGLIVQVILARLLMPRDFACLAIITAIVNYLGIFVQSGLTIAVIQKKDLSQKDLSTLVTISLLAAFILFAGLFIAAPHISNYYNVGDLTWPIRVMGVSLFLYSFNSIQTGILQRRMMFKTIFFRSMLATPISGCIGISMAYLNFGIWSLIAYNISNILAIVFFMNMIPELRLKPGFSIQSAKELYSFSIKILGTSLISAGGDTVRTLTIGKFYNPNQLAFFDRGLSYSGLVTQVVNTSLSSVMLPVLSRAQEDIGQLKELSRRSVGMSSFIMIPILVMVAMLSKPLVLIVLSEKWLPCAFFLSLFCILRIPGIITSIDKQAYYALGKSQIGFYFEAGLLAANLTSLIVMVHYSVIAIAICFTIIEYLGNFVLFIISSRVFQYTLAERLKDMIKPMINSTVMAAVIYSIAMIIDNNILLLLIGIISGSLTYIIMAMITKDDNLQYVNNVITKKI